MSTGLGPLAEDFATTLNRLVEAAVDKTDAFTIIEVPGTEDRRRIGFATFGNTGFDFVPFLWEVDCDRARVRRRFGIGNA